MVTFRKSKKVGPFRFTLSNRGVSTSVGGGPLRISRAADGKLRRTVRVPGLGLYDTKVIGQSAKPISPERLSERTYLDGTASSLAAEPETNSSEPRQRGRQWPWVIGGLILIWMLVTIGSCNKDDGHSSSVSTVTATVTRAAEPTTVTAQPSTVTVAAEAPPAAPVTVTQAPPNGIYDPPAAPAPNYSTPKASSAYYKNCSEARAAGAAPLRRGEPGYRSALDRDDDGVACE
jgi:hypothetical protein